MQPARDFRLEGLRGLATIGVVVSHFLGEVPSGHSLFAVGFVSVIVFFVLSGFLIGRLILDRRDSGNFFSVFYGRRFLRTIPSYAVVLVVVILAAAHGGGWAPSMGGVPAWSYATFTQNHAMGWALEVGNEWLGPTWTLAVEEQFYLVAPLALFLLPCRLLPFAILLAIGASTAWRTSAYLAGDDPLTYLPLLIANADQIAMGVGAAVLLRTVPRIERFDRLLEVLPLLCVSLLAILLLVARDAATAIVLSPLLALAAAAFLLRLAVNAETSRWLCAPHLRSAGHHSYSVYLVHMPVAGVVHLLVTGLRPDVASPVQLVATALSFAATAAVAVLLTRTVEDPATALGRRLQWSPPRSTAPTKASVSERPAT